MMRGAVEGRFAETLAAVHQQFTHILILRKQGEEEVAARIEVTDNEDFKTSMRLADYLAADGALTAPAHLVRFGRDGDAILSFEAERERRLNGALAGIEAVSDPNLARIIGGARAPRRAYGDWLQGRLADVQACSEQASCERGGLVTGLLSLMEQTLVHAYLHHRAENGAAADLAWRVCGASMMHLTALARLFPEVVTEPGGFEVPDRRFGGAEAVLVEADKALARECAAAARERGRAGDGRLAKLCERIAEDCDAIAGRSAEAPLVLGLGDSRMFDRFEKGRAMAALNP